MKTSARHALGRIFTQFAENASRAAGSPLAFILALSSILLWAVTGPMFGYSELWQIVINTVTTVITFLLVFLIQNSQNRETRAIQLKLDEIIRATRGAHNAMLRVEMLSDEELAIICDEYETLAKEARRRLRAGKDDKNAPDIKSTSKGRKVRQVEV